MQTFMKGTKRARIASFNDPLSRAKNSTLANPLPFPGAFSDTDDYPFFLCVSGREKHHMNFVFSSG